MKAIILSAGRGSRLRPFTDHTPKPLLTIVGKPLIEYHLENLSSAGFTEVVINTAHLGHQIEAHVGDGARWGLKVLYSREQAPLEVGGGIFQALPLLGAAPFAVVNGDIWTDFPLNSLPTQLPAGSLGHLILVDNPAHNPTGDFGLGSDGRLYRPPPGIAYTYAGIAMLHPDLFASCQPGIFRLSPLLDQAIAQSALYGEYYGNSWSDVGTMARWEALEKSIESKALLAAPLPELELELEKEKLRSHGNTR